MKLFKALIPFFSLASILAAKSVPSALVAQRCAPCHGPDLNGVGGVFPSLLTSKVVKEGGLDAVVKFITYGSPPESKSLVKMPAKGGHLDLTDEQIKQIAEEVIEHAVAHKPEQVAQPKHTSKKGFFTKRFGPVVSTAIETTSTGTAYIVPRAHLVPFGPDRRAVMVFDSETLSYSFAWMNPQSLETKGMPFGGAHGSAAVTKYEHNLFQTGIRPGWAKAAKSNDSPPLVGLPVIGDPVTGITPLKAKVFKLDDPRPQPYKSYPPMGPLPKDWAHFKGHYVHDGRVIFSYTVGQGTVLDMPGYVSGQGFEAFTRTLETNLPEDSWVVLAQGESAQKVAATWSLNWQGNKCNFLVTDGPAKAELHFQHNLILLHLPKGKHRTKIGIWAGDPAYQPAIQSASGRAENLSAFTQGGASQWGDPLVTKGELSTDDENAYVVDRIGIPFNNQYDRGMRIGAFDFFADGKSAAVCTWDGDVWIVSGIDEPLQKVKWKRFATGLHEPLGLKIVDGKIYTVGDNQITRFHDLNNDGEADFLENFNNDWDATEGFHAFCFDLQTDAKGNFYFSMGCPVRAGGAGFERLGRHHGCVLKISPNGDELSIFASGFRAPNGIGVGPNGEVTTGDNEGSFIPTAPLNWVKPGSFNGVVDSYRGDRELKSSAIEGYEIPYSDWGEYRRSFMKRAGFQHFPEEAPKPLVWMSKKRGVDNSGGGQVWVTSDKWGPLKDQLLHMSYGQSKLYVVLKEEKNGQMQGGVSRIPVELSSSGMRARINPRDGQLYVSGLKGWQTNAKGSGGFDRIRYTGKPVHLPQSLKVMKDRIEVEFYEPLSPAEANDLTKYKFGAWNLKWTSNYGSPEIPLKDLKLEKVELLEDGKTVALHVPNLHPAHMVQVDYELKSAKGQAFTGRIDHTIHEVD